MKSIRLYTIIINLILILICSCSHRASEETMTGAKNIEAIEDPLYEDRDEADDEINPVEIVFEANDKTYDDNPTNMEPSVDPIDESEDLNIILSVNKELKLNETGTLKIWIGSSEIEVSHTDQEVTAKKHLSSGIGQYAKITPYAPDFEITPKIIRCIKIHPSGSEVFFSIKPKKTGALIVSANIEIFDNAECTGAAVPKTAETLSVTVSVDRKAILRNKTNELSNVFWEDFLVFFGGVVSLIFGLILFKFRKKIKNLTGSEEKE